MKVHASDLLAALVTAAGYQWETEQKYWQDKYKSEFLQSVERMVDALKSGENLEIVWPDDLKEL